MAGFAANGSADDTTAFAASLGFFGKFGFGTRTQDHGRISGDTNAGVKSCEQNSSAGGTKTEFRSAVCHPGPVPDERGSTTLGIKGADEGIPRVGQCIVVNRPKQSRFPGEYPKRQSRSFVSGKSVT